MTREEAIEVISQDIPCEYDIDLIEALNMAINALHREQQFLEAGYKNGRVEFNIGGRKFMVKEMAQ